MQGGVSVQGGGLCPGRGSLSREGVSVWGVSVQGVSVQGVSIWEIPPDRDPPYGNERAICILLECILVHFCNFIQK